MAASEKKHTRRLASLDELWYELNRGRIYEAALRDPTWHLDGLQDGDTIYVDPRPAILESLIHELLHRRYPRWGERTVSREARRLIGVMDEGVKTRWWTAYQKTKIVKSRPVDVSAK